MPQIPIITAEGNRGVTEGQPGILRGHAPGPAAFGYQVGQGLTELGRSFTDVADKLQYQQDQLDVVGRAGDYNMRLVEARQEVMQDESLKTSNDRLLAYKKRMDEFGKKLTADANPAVSRTLQKHMTDSLSQGMIQLRADDLARQTNALRAQLSQQQDRSADVEGMAIATGNESGALAARTERRQLLESAQRLGTVSAVEAQNEDQRATNRTWELVATRAPTYMLKLYGNHLAGENPPAGLDTQKMSHYANIAANTLNQLTVANEKQIKATQEQNARLLTADILQGKPTGTAIPDLVRSGGLSDNDGRTLYDLQQKISSAPDMSRYVRGLAAQLEAKYRTLKYSSEQLPPDNENVIASHFINGYITQPEMTHLMGVWQSTVDHRNQTGKEGGNQVVSHAHANLIRSLTTAGPADKYDALSGQTITEAERYFYNQLEANPNKDPWAVMKEAEGIFKPVVKDRLNMSKTDQHTLDDAKMQALLKAKAITPSAYRAWLEQKQVDAGQAIVDQALKSLPAQQTDGFQKWVDSMKSWWPKPEGTE